MAVAGAVAGVGAPLWTSTAGGAAEVAGDAGIGATAVRRIGGAWRGGGGEDVEPRSGRVGRMVGPGGAVGVDVPGRAGAPRAEQDTGDGQAGTDGEDRGERGGDGALGCLREKHDWG